MKTIATKRLENESAKAYEAFRTYAEMGPRRTLAAVGTELGKSATIIERWSSRYSWKERIALWDNEQAERQNKAAERAALETARERERLREQVQCKAADGFNALWEKAELILRMPIERQTVRYHPVSLLTKKARQEFPDGLPETIIEPVNCRVSDAARLIDLADQLGRLAAGMPSKVTGITDVDGKPFTIPQAQPQHIEQYVVRIGYKDKDERDSTERLLDDVVKRQPEIIR